METSLPTTQTATLTVPPAQAHPQSITCRWVEWIKGVAIVWIFLNHISEQLFGGPYFANPSNIWPPLAERFAQVNPLVGYGVLDIPLNLLRYIGWTGDQGVQLFLILSGFGLTWGLLQKGTPAALPFGEFYRRRAARIFPLWWGAHIAFIVLFFITGWGIWIGDSALYASLLGIRITPSLFYYFAPAWWYVGLLIQLYLIYPVLWRLLQRIGALRLLIATCLVAFIARALGLYLLGEYVDIWQRGALFITQIPCFVFGIALAWWWFRQPQQTQQMLNSPRVILLAVAVYVAGSFLQFYLPGMIFAPTMMGVGVFVLIYRLFNGWAIIQRGTLYNGISWAGTHSYSLFLVHQPIIMLLVPSHILLTGDWLRAVAGTAMAVAVTGIGAVGLERLVDGTDGWLHSMRRLGTVRLWVRLALIGAGCVTVLFTAELIVRQFAPQEVLGWGERPSLEPDSAVGWHLRPNSETRLQWASYDYTIAANSLGFPGTEYPAVKPPGTFRIMTVGDAFTSAEGVDTDQSWPRLLEAKLAERLPDQNIEVMNFAITGYGPNQYASIVQTYAPIYAPDLIIVETFVNDYQDVRISNDEFRTSIGFGEPDPFSGFSFLRLMHLRRLLEIEIQPILVGELLKGTPNPNGYFLGNFAALERDQPDLEVAYAAVGERFRSIEHIAESVSAEVMLMMVPAAVQVCDSASLAYYPQYVDLQDPTSFDLDLPQRMTQAIADDINIPFIDLRPALDAVDTCPYQPNNMHWLLSGHEATAQYLTDTLSPQIAMSMAG